MRSQVLAGEKSRPLPLTYDVACVTSQCAACFGFLQPKNSGCRRQKRHRAPFDDCGASTIYTHQHLFLLLMNHRNIFGNLSPELTALPYLFKWYSADAFILLRIFAEVFGISAGRGHIHMTSSKYDACSLDLGCAKPNSTHVWLPLRLEKSMLPLACPV